MPLAAVATDVLSGDDVLLSTGNALEGILASCAIPGTFAPVEIDGRVLMDGGVVSSTRISHAVALGADVVWVPVAHCFTRTAAPTTVLGMALLALTLLLNQRLALDVERFESAVELWVLPPLCGSADLTGRFQPRRRPDRPGARLDPAVAGRVAASTARAGAPVAAARRGGHLDGSRRRSS